MMTLLEQARFHFKRHGVIPVDLQARLDAEGYTDIEALVARDDQLQPEL